MPSHDTYPGGCTFGNSLSASRILWSKIENKRSNSANEILRWCSYKEESHDLSNVINLEVLNAVQSEWTIFEKTQRTSNVIPLMTNSIKLSSIILRGCVGFATIRIQLSFDMWLNPTSNAFYQPILQLSFESTRQFRRCTKRGCY